MSPCWSSAATWESCSIATLLFATGTLRDFRPSLLGKFNTLVQIFGLTVVLVEQVWPSVDAVLLRVWTAAIDRLARAHLRGAVCLDRGAQGEHARPRNRVKRSHLPTTAPNQVLSPDAS